MVTPYIELLNQFFVFIPTIIVTFFVTNYLISYYTKKNMVVRDVTKPGIVMIPRPAGPGIIAGITTGGLLTYFMYPHNETLILLLSISIAFVIGFIDDKRVMKGWFKPVMLIIASIPLLVVTTDGLALPGYESMSILTLYGALILASMPLIGNASNSLDVFNGVVSRSFIIAMITVVFSTFVLDITQNQGSSSIFTFGGVILMVFILYYLKFHRLPTKIFPGDSGSITIGAAYIGFAIMAHVEIIALIAILPAILNSFIFLSSTKKIVEHRELKGKSVILTDDFKLRATKEKTSVSLVRLILTKGDLTEKQINNQISKFMIFSGLLAIGTLSSYFISPLISIIATTGISLILIHKSKHIRLYLFILVVWLMIGALIIPSLNYINTLDGTTWKLLHIIVILSVFIFGLVKTKRYLLKPLYKELEPL